jgi:hypothetical protein
MNWKSISIRVATRQALQLQLLKHLSCNSRHVIFIFFIRRITTQQSSNCNSTCTSIATLQEHFDCNSTSALVATWKALQLQLLKHFSFNYGYVPFIIFVRRIATQTMLQLQHGKHLNCNSSSTLVATRSVHRMQLEPL